MVSQKKSPADFIRRLLVIPTLPIFVFCSVSFGGTEENTANIYFLQALKSKQEGRLLVAERLLKKAIEFEPGQADYHFELGSLCIERGDLVGARLELEQAVTLEPNHLPAHYNLGLVYRELGMMSEARSQFRRVLEIDPQNAKAQLQIGFTYQAEGFFDDARQAFQAAREMDVTDLEPTYALRDLETLELEAQERSRFETRQSLWRNQNLLYQRDTTRE